MKGCNMRALIILLISLMWMCETVETEEALVPIIVDYMYYKNGNHGSLYVKHNNEILYVLEERDRDTLYVPEDWIILTWEQQGVYSEEIYPKEWREYDIYNSTFNYEDVE